MSLVVVVAVVFVSFADGNHDDSQYCQRSIEEPRIQPVLHEIRVVEAMPLWWWW